MLTKSTFDLLMEHINDQDNPVAVNETISLQDCRDIFCRRLLQDAISRSAIDKHNNVTLIVTRLVAELEARTYGSVSISTLTWICLATTVQQYGRNLHGLLDLFIELFGLETTFALLGDTRYRLPCRLIAELSNERQHFGNNDHFSTPVIQLVTSLLTGQPLPNNKLYANLDNGGCVPTPTP